MSNIQILSEQVRNLIAAGEVVERPASVVKELVENSIDAGAGEIRIEVIGGGLEKIVVTDDGAGMDENDLKLCVARHATSKLKVADDLIDIRTMGFRGEALPSISAVSRMTIESRPALDGHLSGHILRMEGGNVIGLEEKGTAAGTKATVADLFYNVPARKKFARLPRTELGHVKDIVEKIALANPSIRFELISDGKGLISAVSLGDERQRAAEIFGSEVVKASYDCGADAGEIRVYGLVSDPSLAKEGTKGIYWFVNRRPVKDRLLNHAIGEAYRSLLPRGYSPFSMLFISLSPGLVDVNVHPTKSEVRFLKGNAVHDFVVSAVKKALHQMQHLGSRRLQPAQITHPKGCGYHFGNNLEGRGEGEQKPCHPRESGDPESPPVCHPRESGDPENPPVCHPCESRDPVNPPAPPFFKGGEQVIPPFSKGGRRGDFTRNLYSPGRFSSLRTIGQLHNSYILCEDANGSLVIIDQHAAHERIGFEKLREGYKSSHVEGQRLLVPEVVQVSSRAAAYLEDALPDLNKLGWEIEHFGGDNFCVKAVPAILGNINLKAAIMAMAEDLAECGKADSAEERIEALMKVSACHAQVRAGDRLGESEIRHLLRDMDSFEWSGRCPHGRPAVFEISLADVEKWFRRT